jgi:hypothetical protein
MSKGIMTKKNIIKIIEFLSYITALGTLVMMIMILHVVLVFGVVILVGPPIPILLVEIILMYTGLICLILQIIMRSIK